MKSGTKPPRSKHGSLSAPWEQWELDPKFFAALSRWTLENPESTLDRVFDRICNAIEHGREFFEAIPDGVFPARGLVKALAHVLILGNMIHRAKRDIQSFAKDVIRWVSEVRSAFDSPRHKIGKFTRITWQNLARMRDLIEEICLWACKRLMDKRWFVSGVKAKLVKDEIAEFKARISETRETFKDRSIIVFAWGLDALIQRIRALLDGQKRIMVTLERIKAAQDDHFDDILAQKEAQMRRQYVTDMLASHAVDNTSYSDQGKLPCDQGTRVDILRDIMDWVNDCTTTSQNFLWLTGDPGSGKSAITASIARQCKDKGFLWAQYFINRNNFDTTNPNAYFPSIARQFSAHSEEVVRSIFDHLKAQPSLLDVMSSEQAANLFIDTIRVASSLDHNKPVVVVIDGLDEADRQHLKSVADIFSRLFSSLSRLPNAKVFISSRTEDDIRNPFARTLTTRHVKHLHLDTSSVSSINDVARFLRRRIAQIVLDNDLDWNIWPGGERFDMLAVRASGLFIWAVTTAKFIQEQVDQWGTECLDDLLNKLNSDGMGDINALYGFILEMSYKRHGDSWAFECFRRIIGAIVVLQEPLCLRDLSTLLSLRRTPASSPVDIIKFVKRLRTVLVAGTVAIDDKTVPRLHKSFYEYITDGARVNTQFYIDPLLSHKEVATRCLYQFTTAKSVIKTNLPTLFRYAARFWSGHLSQVSSTPGLTVMDTPIPLSQFKNLLHVSTNRAESGPIFMKISPDKSVIQASLNNRIRSWSMASGEQSSRPTVFRNHSDYVWVTTYSPDGSRIASCSRDGTICLWSRVTPIRDDRLRVHTDEVLSVSFSPDGQYIVSGSRDNTIRLWSGTGKLIGFPIKGHTAPVTSVVFSPDGERLVSGSGDRTIRRWNVRSKAQIGNPMVGHSGWVNEVRYSPDGTLIVSCSDDCSVRLWKSKTGELIRLLLNGHTMPVNTVTFSPDGKQIVSGSSDNTIRFWDLVTGKQDGEPLERHTGGLRCVAFSPNGKQIVSCSTDNTIRFWDVETRYPIGSPLTGHSSSVTSVAFSPDGDNIVSSSTDNTTRMWNAPLGEMFGALCTSFSPSGKWVLSASLDRTIRLWHWRKQKLVDSVLDSVGTGNIVSVAFSQNESRVAVASTDSVSIWKTSSRTKLTKIASTAVTDVMSINFPAGIDHLLRVVCQTGGFLLLREQDGKLTTAAEHDVSLEYSDDAEESQDSLGGSGLQWYPSMDPNSGFSAYINGHIIRAREDGSIVVVAADTYRWAPRSN